MAAGGPGDHPLTDIVRFNLDVYSPAFDELIRKISKYVSLKNLSEMFDWFGYASAPTKSQIDNFEKELELKFNHLKNEATNNGWETD